ncbi:acyl carrier protein phosphodiesterase [Salmonella enterica subsp. arizonae]|nr:acyl carrier protein phosphodiesterase [Salmonella enterica subsp. arizonae]
MNFLAHLHLAHLADSSLSGNLLADFVRGNPATHYPPDVVEGIYMHRRIDVMTDNLPEVREAREWFRHETRRVAPITLDVMWDHFFITPLDANFPRFSTSVVYRLCSCAGRDYFARFPAALCQPE